MTKNSTPDSILSPSAVASSKQGPAKATLAKIRQFARAYTFVPVKVGALGGIMAN